MRCCKVKLAIRIAPYAKPLMFVSFDFCRMASEMFLYWGSGSPPCWRAMLVLEEKGLSGYPNKLVSFEKKEHKSEEILKWNPRGQV